MNAARRNGRLWDTVTCLASKAVVAGCVMRKGALETMRVCVDPGCLLRTAHRLRPQKASLSTHAARWNKHRAAPGAPLVLLHASDDLLKASHLGAAIACQWRPAAWQDPRTSMRGGGMARRESSSLPKLCRRLAQLSTSRWALLRPLSSAASSCTPACECASSATAEHTGDKVSRPPLQQQAPGWRL